MAHRTVGVYAWPESTGGCGVQPNLDVLSSPLERGECLSDEKHYQQGAGPPGQKKWAASSHLLGRKLHRAEVRSQNTILIVYCSVQLYIVYCSVQLANL